MREEQHSADRPRPNIPAYRTEQQSKQKGDGLERIKLLKLTLLLHGQPVGSILGFV